MSRVPMASDDSAIAVDPSITFDQYFVPQSIGADIIATEYEFSRDQGDALAVESQKRAKISWDQNRFSKSIIPVKDINGLTILAYDEFMRPGTDIQSLGALKPSLKDQGEVMPSFDKIAVMKYPHLEKIYHIHHAGNSSGIVDGAAALLISNKEFGKNMDSNPAPKLALPRKLAPTQRSC